MPAKPVDRGAFFGEFTRTAPTEVIRWLYDTWGDIEPAVLAMANTDGLAVAVKETRLLYLADRVSRLPEDHPTRLFTLEMIGRHRSRPDAH